MRRVFLLAAAGAAGLLGAGWSAAPAVAVDDPEAGVWVGSVGPDASASVTTPDHLEITVSVSGDHLVIHEERGLNAAPIGDASTDMFTPPVGVEDEWLGLSVSDEDCDEGTTCDRGTLTIGFSDPVLHPIVHVSGLGSLVGNEPAGTAQLALVGSEPPGAELTQPAENAANLTVADGVLQATNPASSPALCANGAGCGSVAAPGVVTELTFDVSLLNVVNGTGDGISLLVSAERFVPEEPAPEEPEQPVLPVTGAPALGLLGLGAAGLLLGGALFGGVKARSRRLRWRGVRRRG